MVMERGGFIPEGIEFDTPARRFLTGSLVDDAIYVVQPHFYDQEPPEIRKVELGTVSQ
jgi:hypothetical protein